MTNLTNQGRSFVTNVGQKQILSLHKKKNLRLSDVAHRFSTTELQTETELSKYQAHVQLAVVTLTCSQRGSLSYHSVELFNNDSLNADHSCECCSLQELGGLCREFGECQYVSLCIQKNQAAAAIFFHQVKSELPLGLFIFFSQLKKYI